VYTTLEEMIVVESQRVQTYRSCMFADVMYVGMCFSVPIF